MNLTGRSQSTGADARTRVGARQPRLAIFSSFYLGYSAPRVSQAITPDGHDADLHAEHSANYEVGARARASNWLRAEGTGFLINFDNQLVSNNPPQRQQL